MGRYQKRKRRSLTAVLLNIVIVLALLLGSLLLLLRLSPEQNAAMSTEPDDAAVQTDAKPVIPTEPTDTEPPTSVPTEKAPTEPASLPEQPTAEPEKPTADAKPTSDAEGQTVSAAQPAANVPQPAVSAPQTSGGTSQTSGGTQQTTGSTPPDGIHSVKCQPGMHNWVHLGIHSSNPTCTSPGMTTEVCGNCLELRYVETEPAFGHNWVLVEESTASEYHHGFKKWYCDRCEMSQITDFVQMFGPPAVPLEDIEEAIPETEAPTETPPAPEPPTEAVTEAPPETESPAEALPALEPPAESPAELPADEGAE